MLSQVEFVCPLQDLVTADRGRRKFMPAKPSARHPRQAATSQLYIETRSVNYSRGGMEEGTRQTRP